MPPINFLFLDSRDLGGDSTGFDTNSFVPQANKTHLLICSGIGSAPPPEPIIPVVTGNALTWSLVASQKFDWSGTNRGIVSIFRGLGSSPTPGVAHVQYNRQFFRQAIQVWLVDNTDIGNLGANAIAAAVTLKLAAGAGLNPSVTMPAASDPANASLGIIAYRDPNPAVVAGIGFSLLLNLVNAEGGGHALELSPVVKTTIDWNMGTDPDFALIGVELANATPAPPPPEGQVLGRPAFVTGNLIT